MIIRIANRASINTKNNWTFHFNIVAPRTILLLQLISKAIILKQNSFPSLSIFTPWYNTVEFTKSIPLVILTANEFKRHTQFPGDRKLHCLSRSSGDSSIFPASMKQSCRLDDYSRSALCSRTARNTGLGLILTMATTKFLTGLGLRVYRGVMARSKQLIASDAVWIFSDVAVWRWLLSDSCCAVETSLPKNSYIAGWRLAYPRKLLSFVPSRTSRPTWSTTTLVPDTLLSFHCTRDVWIIVHSVASCISSSLVLPFLPSF